MAIGNTFNINTSIYIAVYLQHPHLSSHCDWRDHEPNWLIVLGLVLGLDYGFLQLVTGVVL